MKFRCWIDEGAEYTEEDLATPDMEVEADNPAAAAVAVSEMSRRSGDIDVLVEGGGVYLLIRVEYRPVVTRQTGVTRAELLGKVP